MPSRVAVALLGISLVSGSGNGQPSNAAGPEHFEIRGAHGKVLIGADDVLAYEWASHTLTLKPKVRKNLFEKLKGNLVSGEPFIVAVGGKAVYQGTWKSVLSSISCATPVIVLDGRAVDPKLGEDQVRIELGYPSKDFFKGDDPRGDQRVRNALKASGKLKQGRPRDQARPAPEKLQSEDRPAELESAAERPKADRAQEPDARVRATAWGHQSHGLSCRAKVPVEVEQGMPLVVKVELRSNPQKLDPEVKQINTFLLPAFLELSLSDPHTQKSFTVRPYDPTKGMPAVYSQKLMAPLDGTPLKPCQVRFPLAKVYEQLQPGLYACRIQYSFPNTPTRFWARGEKEWREAGFWHGTVFSAPFHVKVIPETPKTRTLLLPKRLRVVKQLVQLRADDAKKTEVPVVCFRSGDAEKVTVPVRNGHFVMAQYYRDGEFYRMSVPPKPDDVNAIDTWYDYRGGDNKASYTIEVFETRDPIGHHGVFPSRHSGGYKVLWKKTLPVSVSEQQFRELRPTTSGLLGADLVAELASKDISNEARDAIVEQLSRSDASTTAPKILELLGKYRCYDEPGGNKPWMDDSRSHRAKVWYASRAIWDALFRGEADPAKVRLLLRLLGDHDDLYLRYVLLETMQFQWTDEAEKPVFSFFQDRQVPPPLRSYALKLLLEHCGEWYVPHAIYLVESAPPKEKSVRFHRVIGANISSEFFSYSEKTQQRILSLGFSILEDEARPGTGRGYRTATRLGFYLKIPDEFQPDRRAPEYQGRAGLSAKFFSDTVQNALQWRRKNRKPLESLSRGWILLDTVKTVKEGLDCRLHADGSVTLTNTSKVPFQICLVHLFAPPPADKGDIRGPFAELLRNGRRYPHFEGPAAPSEARLSIIRPGESFPFKGGRLPTAPYEPGETFQVIYRVTEGLFREHRIHRIPFFDRSDLIERRKEIPLWIGEARSNVIDATAAEATRPRAWRFDKSILDTVKTVKQGLDCRLHADGSVTLTNTTKVPFQICLGHVALLPSPPADRGGISPFAQLLKNGQPEPPSEGSAPRRRARLSIIWPGESLTFEGNPLPMTPDKREDTFQAVYRVTEDHLRRIPIVDRSGGDLIERTKQIPLWIGEARSNVIKPVSGSGNGQPANAAGPEHFEIRGAEGKVLIGADDVLAYEWASHTLTLRPKVRKNLLEKLKGNLVRGEPFAVAAGGAVVYQGTWKSVASSISCATPVIVLDGRVVDPKLGEDQVCIELGYPSKDFFKGDDPRGDQRVRKALKASGKLKQGRPRDQAPPAPEKPQSEDRPVEAARRPSPPAESVAATAERLTQLHLAKKWPEVQALHDELVAGDRTFAAEVISIVLRNPKIETRTHLIGDAREAGLKEIVPTLVSLLDDSDKGVRASSVAGLGDLGDRRAIGPLQRLLEREKDPYARHGIRLSLAKLGRPYLGYFISGLSDRDIRRRDLCISALGILKDGRAVPHLLKVLEESKDTWGPMRAADAISRITGIENTVVIKTIKRADGSVNTEGRRRPADEIKKDCLAWLARHRDEVSTPVEKPCEPWKNTPEPFLPGLNVAFTMDARQVADVYRKAGLECQHHAEKRWEKGGGESREPEQIAAAKSCLDSLNEDLLGIRYLFENNRLAEIRIERVGHGDSVVQPLVEPLKLRKIDHSRWWGLDSSIVVQLEWSDAEKQEYGIRLRRWMEGAK